MNERTITITVGRFDAEIILPELASGRRPWMRHGLQTRRQECDVEITGTFGGWRKRLAELAGEGELDLVGNLTAELDRAGTRWAAMLDGEVNFTGTLDEVRERVAHLDRHARERDVYLAVIEPHFGDGLARG